MSNWKKIGFIVCFVHCFVCSTGIVSDEEYALMPDVFQVEDYDVCMLFKEKALYCEVTYELSPIDSNNPPAVWKTIKEVSASDMHYRHDKIRYFLCVTKSCPNVNTVNASRADLRREINGCLNNKQRNLGFQGKAAIVNCKGLGSNYDVDIGDWIFAIVMFLNISLVLLSTAYDSKNRKDAEHYKTFKDTRGGRIITAFSIINSWNKLKSVPSGPAFEKFRSVQGLRIYFSVLILGVHTLLTQVAIPISNPKFVEDSNDGGAIAADLPKRLVFILSFFFMMSSWMVMSSILAKHDKKEEVDLKFVIKSVIKRYVRFVPTLAVTVGFYATWFRHMDGGAYFDGLYEECEKCRQNWWANLLLIQNHYNRYYMCHIVTWYLAVEIQYYVITLLLLMFVLKKNISILGTVGVLLVTNLVFAFLDHWRHGYGSKLRGRPEDIYKLGFNKEAHWHDHFASYHGNAAGYIIGLGFGYISYQCWNRKLFVEQWKKQIWTVVTSCFIITPYILPLFYDVDATPTHSALWVTATRPIFAFGMGLFVLGLGEGLGGTVRSILNWSPLYVLGKLSFSVYVGHIIIQNIRVINMRAPGAMSYFGAVQTHASDTLLCFLFALWLYLFFEMPSNAFANNLFAAPKKPTEKKSTVRSILNWSPLYVLGKLSFSVYVGHIIIQNIRVINMRAPGAMSYFGAVQTHASDTLLCFLFALWLYLFFEMPSNAFANNLFAAPKKPTEKKSK